ncbi:MAG TPA: hypothetical protein VLH10_23875 [Yinghuangia sp.]|uniref:hypothetical protein n=1 Tax=Yinghuangia sp. YIM S10712 TaxID=3436930 RepID=UPI002BD32F43|nr:hypothetical protein [Yinghuangia sp.]
MSSKRGGCHGPPLTTIVFDLDKVVRRRAGIGRRSAGFVVVTAAGQREHRDDAGRRCDDDRRAGLTRGTQSEHRARVPLVVE